MGNSQGKVNSKVLIIILVVLLALAGLYWFVLRDDSDTDSSKTSSTTSTSQAKSDSLDYNGSLASLAAAGKARKCTFTYNADSGSTGTGTSYTDGKGKSRLTIVTTSSDGKQSTIETIVKDGKSYAWFVSGDQSFGYITDAKVPQSSEASSSSTTSTSTSQNGTVSADQKFSMKCASWTVDDSQFTVPTTINFVTLPSASGTQP